MLKTINEKTEFSLNAIWKLIIINKRLFLLLVLLFTGFSVIYSFITPHYYSAVASILPPSSQDKTASLGSLMQGIPIPSSIGGFGGLSGNQESQVFAEVLRSRTVAEAVAKELDLYNFWGKRYKYDEELIKDLRDKYTKIWVERNGVIYFSSNIRTGYFASKEKIEKTKQIAAEIPNIAARTLDEIMRQRSVSSARKSKEYIIEELDEYYDRMKELELRIEQFQKDNKAIAIDEQTQAIVSQAIEIGKELSIAELELNIAKLEMESASPIVQGLEKKYKLLLEQYGKIQRGGLTSDDAFSIPLDKVPALLREYASMYRERKIMEEIIAYLEMQKHQEAIQEKRDVPVVELIDEAVPPHKRSSPKRSVIVVLGFALSSLFSLVLIIGNAIIKGNIYLNKVKNEENL